MDKRYVLNKLNSIFDGIYHKEKRDSELLLELNTLIIYIDSTYRGD